MSSVVKYLLIDQMDLQHKLNTQYTYYGLTDITNYLFILLIRN